MAPAPSTPFEAVVGLEVHVQIKSASKIFSRVGQGYGLAENTLTDPVVMALPGALPVMNKVALDAVIKAGLMLHCDIAEVCKWDRKNYFYPDSPKNYQISQYDQPMCRHGRVEIELPGSARNIMGEHRDIPLTRIHLEEDVGKLSHGPHDSLVDYNRAGTPLMEIVSEPAIKSAAEAYAYLTTLRTIMIYAGISDGDMEKGQLRCDANISVRPVGQEELGVKVELKNLNSISYVRDGIEHEIKRQLSVVEQGGVIAQETRDFDGITGTSQTLRSKEDAHDYRYFPDPDLMPVRVDQAWQDRLAAQCPERPFDKQRRFMADYDLPYTITAVLIPDRELSDWFEEAVAKAGPAKAQMVANWLINDLLRELSGADQSLCDCSVTPQHLADLVGLIDAGLITKQIAREVLAATFATGEAPAAVVERKGLDHQDQIDLDELERWCREAIAGNAPAREQFLAGKDRAINAFKGPVMRASRGKIDPRLVDETLRRLLAPS